jgi:CubicO group peptidase (beta-lactamase class C family)
MAPRRLTLNAALIVLSTLAPTSARSADGLPHGDAKAEGFAPEALARIDTMLDDSVARREIAGGAALVARNGKVVYLATSGQRDAEAGLPIESSTIYRIASMTKPVTSVAVMMLREQGKLRLDDPLSRFIPEFKAAKVLATKPTGKTGPEPATVPAEREITIHDLLTHTSGLTYRFFDATGLYAAAGVSDGLCETPGNIADNVARIAKVPLLHQPGTAWQYGLNTDVLGRVVEVASGRTLDELFRERIFQPLGMIDTHFIVPEPKRHRLASLYGPATDKSIQRVNPGRVQLGDLVYSATYPTWDASRYFSGGAGLSSTIGDYARFLQMVLNRGELDGTRLLMPESVDLMSRNQIGQLQIGFPHHGDAFGYGFGVLTARGKTEAFRRASYDDVASVGTLSWGGAFNSYFWVDPERRLIGILMTQIYPSDHLKVREQFKRFVYEAMTSERVRPRFRAAARHRSGPGGRAALAAAPESRVLAAQEPRGDGSLAPGRRPTGNIPAPAR